jgi:hypothetical protein
MADKTIVPLVHNERGEFIEGALVFTQTTDIAGAFCLNGGNLIVPDTLQNTQFTVAAAGYKAYSHSIDLGVDGDKQIRVGLPADPARPQDVILPALVDESQSHPVPPNPIPIPPPSGDFERILIEGKGFVTEAGVDWHQYNLTAFKLFYKYIHGEDITPFLSWAAQRANTMRVFFTCKQEFDLQPEHYTWNDVINFHELLRSFNLHCEVVAFADYALIFGDDNARALNYYHGLCDTLRQVDNKFLELVNEYDVSVNHLPVNLFPMPDDIMCSHGSGGGDIDPVTPPWKYMTFHPGRSSEWPRKPKSAREFQELHGVPCTNNETNRPDLAGFDVSDFSDCGFVSGILSSGTNAHSLALKHCDIPSGAEFDCIVMLLDSVRAVPTYANRGRYTRGTATSDGECPMFHSDQVALRTFATLFDTEAYCVIVRPTAANPRKAVNGWRIDYQIRNFYHLVR